VIFETQDESVWRAHLRALRGAPARIDWTLTRLDTLCGPPGQPATHRLSLLMPEPGGDRR
jgi:hypothetical protein